MPSDEDDVAIVEPESPESRVTLETAGFRKEGGEKVKALARGHAPRYSRTVDYRDTE